MQLSDDETKRTLLDLIGTHAGQNHLRTKIETYIRRMERKAMLPLKRVIKVQYTINPQTDEVTSFHETPDGERCDRSWAGGRHRVVNIERRPTEYWAMFHWRHGWFDENRIAYTGNHDHDQYAAAPIDFEYEVKPTHPDAVGQVCIECRQRKPLSADFFYRDRSYANGFKAQCVTCYKRARRERYARQAA